MQQDLTYGIRQLADVALKALSPGINDPTTAQDAMFHLGVVLHELLTRRPPARELAGPDGQRLVLAQAITPQELVDLAFYEVRIASSGQPTVQIYLLEILQLLSSSLDPIAGEEAKVAMRRQADLIVAVSDLANLPAADLERARSAHRHRFAA